MFFYSFWCLSLDSTLHQHRSYWLYTCRRQSYYSEQKQTKETRKKVVIQKLGTFHFSLLTKIFYYLVPVIDIRIWDILKILKGNFRFFFLYLFFKENSKWIWFLFSWSKIVHKKIENKDYDLGIFYFYPHWYLKVSHTTLIDLLTTVGSISSNTSIFKKGNDNTKFYLMIMDHND